jgi:hypothetical protein
MTQYDACAEELFSFFGGGGTSNKYVKDTHTLIIFNFLLFHDDDGYANAHRYQVTRALSGLVRTSQIYL